MEVFRKESKTMEKEQKLNNAQSIGLILIVIINQIILNLASYLISETSSSSWLNIIYITVLLVFFILLICKLFKPFSSCDLLDVSEFLGGNVLKVIIGILYILFFIFFCAISLRHISTSLKLIYFEDTPLVYIMLFFIIPATICSMLRYKKYFKAKLSFNASFFN